MTSLLTLPLSAPVAVLVALIPAAFTAWRGFKLARLVDDPALPERLLASRTRSGVVTGVCFGLVYAGGGTHATWALPLLIVTRLIAGYRLRKALYRETWSFLQYVWFFTRLLLAAMGFWILLGGLPWLARLAGPRDWIVAGALAAVLLAWSERFATILRRVMRARPVVDPVIRSRFAEMIGACALPDVTLEQVDVRGGMFVNAVALPSMRRSAVLITSSLLERLDHDETAAVLAHELAHVEHYNPRRVRGMRVTTWVLIAVGALLTPAARLTMPQATYALLYLWQIVLTTVMVLRARDRQKHETASDARAIALCGNPDALVRALTKLHVSARVPRRWDVEWERQATHPSLARRIQAIHAAAGTAPASLGEAAAFAGADASSSVTFHHDRLVWSDDGSASHTLPYERLTMLRVEARASGGARLVAIDSAHRRWELRLHASDVARAQATLDIVDTRLGAMASPAAVSLALPRWLALTAAIAAISVQQYPAALVALIPVFLPALPLTAAAGAAALGVAALMVRDSVGWTLDWRPWFSVVLFVCGAALIAVAVANRRERTSPAALRLMWLLAAGVIVTWGALAFSVNNAVELYRGVRAWPSAVVFALGLSGAFAFTPSRAARLGSGLLAAAGLAAIFMGSTGFLDRFAHDPFLAPSGPLIVRAIATDPLTEFSVPFEATAISLSPGGRYVALGSEDEEDETTIHAGLAGGPLASFRADDALFVDAERVLLLERERKAAVLRVVDLERGSESTWTHRVALSYVRLSFDRPSKAWHLLGFDENGEIVKVSGVVDSENVSEERWTDPSDDDSNINALAAARGDVLALETRHSPSTPGNGTFARLASLVRPDAPSEYRMWTVGDRGSSAIAVSHLVLACRTPVLDGSRTICAAFDGTRTGLFSLNAASRGLAPFASVEGHFYMYGDAGSGWLMGRWEGRSVLIRAATHEAIQIAPRNGEQPDRLAIEEDVVGAVTSNDHASTVRMYSIK